MGLITTVLNPGAGGASVVTDQQVSGAQMPVSELAFSAAGGDSAVATAANPFPVTASGKSASGAAVSGNPVLIGGSDGVDARSLLTDSSGRPEIVGAVGAGSLVAGNPVLIGGTDGARARTVLTDGSGRPEIVGAAAAGSAALGNPVLIGGTHAGTAQTLTTDSLGNLIVVGEGTAGTPAGGVVSVQGLSGGTVLPVIAESQPIDVLNNGTITGSNLSNTYTNLPLGQFYLYINVANAPTGTNPVLFFEVIPVDPSGALGNAAGVQAYTSQKIIGPGYYILTGFSASNSLEVIGSIGLGGAGTSFTGVTVTLVPGVPPAEQQVIPFHINQTLSEGSGLTNFSGNIGDVPIGPILVQIDVGGAPTGTLPTLTYSGSSVDPSGSGTIIGGITNGPTISAAGYFSFTFLNLTGVIQIQAQLGGTNPSFTNVQVYVAPIKNAAQGLVASGAAVEGNPVLMGGSDGVDARTILTDASGRQEIVGPAASGAAVAGNPVLIGGTAGQETQTIRVKRDGTAAIGNSTLLAQDFIEGATVNTWLWITSATTMVNAQTTGILTMNSGGTTTTATDTILTSTVRFPLTKQAPILAIFRAQSAQTTNAVAELGFGAPVGVTALVNDGAFFRIKTGNQVFAVTSWNGTETVSALLATLSTTSYYVFSVWIEDDGARFVIEDANGIPVVDIFQANPLAQSDIISVSHIPAFARVYNSGAAGTAPTLKISSFSTWQYDWATTKSFAEQMAGTGRSGNVNPTTFAQTAQLAAGAAPGTVTPAATTSAYATLGGEFVCNGTASSENLLGVFGFQVPSPYGLYVTDISLPQPFITSALGAVVHIQEWCLMVASSGNPSTATGQRYTLGMFSAAASAVAGTVLNGQPLQLRLTTPIFVPAGQFLLVLVKIISGSAAGIYRGSILVNGYYQ